MEPNNRLELTAALRESVRPRSSAWALGGLKSDVNEIGLTGEMVSHTIPS